MGFGGGGSTLSMGLGVGLSFFSFSFFSFSFFFFFFFLSSGLWVVGSVIKGGHGWWSPVWEASWASLLAWG